VGVREPVDLVQGDDHRDTEWKDAARDEPVSRADPVARADHEQDEVDVVERPVHRALHALRERIDRTLEAG
jgi:hypothetical protein